ncbi:MAG TPA: M20 family metallo-hydrolase [Candidatus Krumholzibacteria bacterium]|nr:M20 family metallo-hydrolase [Candidatus Krumholzibacteria bacterium]
METNALSTVLKRIDGYHSAVVELQTELCKRPALDPSSGGSGETEKAAWLESYLKKLGLAVTHYDAPDARVPGGKRPNLVTYYPKNPASGPRLWIIAHTDVVPPGDPALWTGDPWKVRVKGDVLMGRGVEDNQGGLCAAVMAVKAFIESGVEPALPFALAFVADEETGSVYGLRHLIENHKSLFRKDDLIVIPDSGNPHGTEIEIAEKGILWVKFRTLGKQTHGSVPATGINAHKAGAYLIGRLESLYQKFNKRDKLFHPSNSTFEPTKKEGNVPNINTIPGEDVMYFDCRILPAYKLDQVIRAMKTLVKETERKFKVKIEMTFAQKETPAPPTPADSPVAVAIASAVKSLRRKNPKAIGIGGGTVAKYLREAGFPCVVWATLDEQAHRPDEYVRVSYILSDAKVFAHVALGAAKAPRAKKK